MKIKKDMQEFVLITCWCVFMVACHKKDDDSAFKANVAVYHFVLNADSLSVLYDDNKVTGNPSLSFGVTTSLNGKAYLRLGAGTHDLKLMAGNTLLKENTLSTTAGSYYSLILFDSVKNNTVKTALVQDVVVPVSTLSQVRFINTIPGSDTLSVTLARAVTVVRGTDIYIGNKSSLAYAFDTLHPGNWQVSLLRNSTEIARLDSFSLQAGKLYSFVAKGLKGGAGAYKESLVAVPNN